MEPRTVADRVFKTMLRLFLEDKGQLETEREVAGESKRMDAYFVPDLEKIADDLTLGALGRMGERPCVMEGYKQAPSPREVFRCVVKLGMFWERLELDQERARRKAKEKDTKTDLSRNEVPKTETRLSLSPEAQVSSHDSLDSGVIILPTLWIISAGVPKTALSTMGCQPMNGWPNGFYRPAEWWPFRIVAVPHLPETPDTLALRLMGRGEILKQAVEELDVRRHDGFHWKEVARRMIDAHRSGPAAADPDWEEMNMHTQKLMKDIEADAHEAGREEGLEAGLEAGREEGLLPFLVLLSERLGRSLTDAEEQTMRSRLRERGGVVLWTSIKDFDRAALEVWLQPSSL